MAFRLLRIPFGRAGFNPGGSTGGRDGRSLRKIPIARSKKNLQPRSIGARKEFEY